MAGTILVRELLRRASDDLNDLSPQFQRYAQADMAAYLHDACLALVTYLPTYGTRTDSIMLRPGTRQSIETLAPTSVIQDSGGGANPPAPVIGISLVALTRNMGPSGVVPGRSIRIVDRKTLDSSAPDWHDMIHMADAVSTYCYDPLVPKVFWVSPPASSDTTVWVDASYVAQPDRVPDGSYDASGANTTVIPVADDAINFLVPYICARAHMKDTEWSEGAKAQAFSAVALSWLNPKVAALTGTNPNLKRLPLAPMQIGGAS